MAKCHQCAKDAGEGPRSGKCSICHKKDAVFCQTCAMWELGPRDDELKNLPKTLSEEPKRALDVPRQKHDKEEELATLSDNPLTCRDIVEKLGKSCKLIEEQRTNKKATLYGIQFQEYVCRAIATFNRLYKTCCHDRLMMHILLAMHLSAQERVQCRTTADKVSESQDDDRKFTHRWDTRMLAAAHLRKHQADIETEFARKGLLSDEAAALALGWDDIEYFLKGLKHITLVAIDLLALCGGSKDLAKRTLEIAVLLYHTLTAVRTCDKDPSDKGAPVAITSHWSKDPQGGFHPRHALGYLSKEHFQALYGKTGKDKAGELAADVQKQINRLYTVLDDVGKPSRANNKLPAHPRFPDDRVKDNTHLQGDGWPVVRNYLQYLPAFDHPKARKAERTECEQTVRDRVAKRAKALVGGDVEKLLDELYVEMRDKFVVDQAYDRSVLQLVVGKIKANRSFPPKGWFPVFAEDIGLAEVFPDCGFDKETYEGVRMHYTSTVGKAGVTSGRPAHYLDWRNAKDHWLYEGFHIPMRCRPLFASLSVQPVIPEPNPLYGSHAFLYRRGRIQDRYVMTLGDKQQPCRSVLLLLDRVLCKQRTKDDDEPRSAADRLKVFSMVVERHKAIGKLGAKTLLQQWTEQLTKAKVPPVDSTLLFECQIFGPVSADTDVSGIVVSCIDEGFPDPNSLPKIVPNQQSDTKTLQDWATDKKVAFLVFDTINDDLKYTKTRPKMPAEPQQFAPLTAPPKKAKAREALIDKPPE